MNNEISYTCDACGEEIVIPLDRSAGASQEFVEDCPVCCHANVIHINIDKDGEAGVGGGRVIRDRLKMSGPPKME